MTARELITEKFVRIGEGHSLSEAIGILFDPHTSALRNIVIVVLDGQGGYVGLLEPRNILASLGTTLSLQSPEMLATAIRSGVAVTVAEAVRRDVPAVRMCDNLATLLHTTSLTDAAMLPVFDDGEFAGVIPVTAIFDALCKLTVSSARDLPFVAGA